jgi:hypothetical protein
LLIEGGADERGGVEGKLHSVGIFIIDKGGNDGAGRFIFREIL